MSTNTDTYADRLASLERKIDMIIDALGLSPSHRMAGAEIDAAAAAIVLQFQRRRGKKQERKL
jgi:hypothetical protein